MEAVIQSTVRYLLLWHPSRVHSCNCCYSYLQFKVQDYQKSISPSTGCSSMTFNSSNYNKVWEHQPLSWNGVCGAWFEFVNWWQWTLCCMFIWTFWYKSFPSCKHLTIGVKPIGAQPLLFMWKLSHKNPLGFNGHLSANKLSQDE